MQSEANEALHASEYIGLQSPPCMRRMYTCTKSKKRRPTGQQPETKSGRRPMDNRPPCSQNGFRSCPRRNPQHTYSGSPRDCEGTSSRDWWTEHPPPTPARLPQRPDVPARLPAPPPGRLSASPLAGVPGSWIRRFFYKNVWDGVSYCCAGPAHTKCARTANLNPGRHS